MIENAAEMNGSENARPKKATMPTAMGPAALGPLGNGRLCAQRGVRSGVSERGAWVHSGMRGSARKEVWNRELMNVIP